jgi:regulator of sigma E protease
VSAFWAKSKKARTAVIVAGVLANFLLAVVVFSIVYSIIGIPTKGDQIMVLGTAPNSPAEEAGFKENDVVVRVNGAEIKEVSKFVEIIDQSKGKEIDIQVERDGEELVFSLVPREEPPEGEGALGVVVSNLKMVHYPFWQMPFRGVIEGFKEAFGWATVVITSLGGIIRKLITTGAAPDEVAGPVGILQLTGSVAQSGPLMILQFMGMLSINLTVINILPFPALDGGRLLFVGIEAVTGKRPKASYERWIHAMGMIILLFLILLVTINDVARVFRTSGLISQLRSLLPF